MIYSVATRENFGVDTVVLLDSISVDPAAVGGLQAVLSASGAADPRIETLNTKRAQLGLPPVHGVDYRPCLQVAPSSDTAAPLTASTRTPRPPTHRQGKRGGG